MGHLGDLVMPPKAEVVREKKEARMMDLDTDRATF